MSNLDPKKAIGESKTPLQLLPPVAMEQCAKALGFGAGKYGAWNWRTSQGVEIQTYIGAMRRHLDAYQSSEECADDSGVHHLGHIMASCAILLDAASAGKLHDNRPGTIK